MLSAYQVISTTPWTYLDQLGKAISGYQVTFKVLPYNEFLVTYVPRLDAALIKTTIDAMVAERDKLGALGKG